MQGYWQKNVKIMIVLLAIWAFVGLGCGVLFADWLNQFQLGGFPLGFWFAQQGSIVVFIVLILVYCLKMDRIDAEFNAGDPVAPTSSDEASEDRVGGAS